MSRATISLIYFIETITMVSIMALIYFYGSVLDNTSLAIISLIVFLIFYNICNLKAFKTGIHFPLWIFPLAISIVSTVSLFVTEICLFLYYAVLIASILLVSSPRTLNKIINSLSNNNVYVYIMIFGILITYSSPLPYKSWIALGPFTEFLVADYLLTIYSDAVMSSERKNISPYLYGVFAALPASFIIYITLPLILYTVIVNFLKLCIRSKNIVPISFILDMLNRFVLLGGVTWIIDMLSSV